jgi:RNA recognition motif-containing protein
LSRCDIKGTYAFVTYDNEKDGEDAIKELNAKEINGCRIAVEWAKGSGRYEGRDRRGGGSSGRRRSPYRDEYVFFFFHPFIEDFFFSN